MSLVELAALLVTTFALATLLAIALEVRRRARHLRQRPEWKTGDKL